MTIKLVLADAHPIFRRGMRALLDAETGLTTVGEASDGKEAVELIEQLKPDVAVLDLTMPKLNGLDVLRAIGNQGKKTKCVVISTQTHNAVVGEALTAGATGYVLKEGKEQNLVRAVREAAAGRRFISPLLDHKAIDDYIANSRTAKGNLHDTLTRREREVLQLSATGLTSVQIAARLHISPRTVECHRANLMRKLQLNKLPDLIRYAFKHKLIPLEK